MFHLIERVLPAPLHRALLPLAHRLRDAWRRWRGVPIAGCAVVIENDAGEILLLRHSYGPRGWALPGGGIGRGEAPEAAARREIAEELAMDLARLDFAGRIEEVLSGSPHTAYLFAAVSDAPPQPDGREVIEARFFPIDALPEPLGEITRRRLEAWERSGTRA
ncbi:MAG: NUDIX domain-containing protein [Erythrobacter sp.]|uniref:NUDIX domain-containing protein n=1 Tax=Erythrobacter sp. TaxID=1042 RepID=UPI0032EDEC7F